MIGHKNNNLIAWTILGSFQTVHLLFPLYLLSQLPSFLYRQEWEWWTTCRILQCSIQLSLSRNTILIFTPVDSLWSLSDAVFHFCSYKEWLLHLLYASKLSSLLMSTLPVNSIVALFPPVHFHASCSEIRWGGSIKVYAPCIVKNQNSKKRLFKDIDT